MKRSKTKAFDRDQLVGQVLAHRYEIGGLLGQGSLGRVYEVYDSQLQRKVALKVIRSEIMSESAADYLRHEFRILSSLHHPHIVKVFDFGRIPGRDLLYFTEELVTGFPVMKVLKRVPLELQLRIFCQVLRALTYIHARGLIHSDLKPKNLYVTESEAGKLTVKLIDFHLSRREDNASDGVIRGTLSYMAPEVIKGQTVDTRSDLYALGLMAFQAVAKHRPFQQKNALELMQAHVSQPLPDLRQINPNVPEGFCRFIEKLSAKDPEQRFPSARAALRALRLDVDGQISIESVRTRAAYLKEGPLIARDHALSFIQHAITRLSSQSRSRRMLRPRQKPRGGLKETAAMLAGHSLSRSISINLSAGRDTGPQFKALPEVELTQPVLQLIGEEGIGKSRILRQVQIEAQLGGVALFKTQVRGMDDHAYAPFITIFQELIDRLNMGSLMADVAPQGVLDEDRVCARASGNPETLAEGLANLFDDFSRALPFIATIDQFEDADPESMNFIEALAARPQMRAVFIVAQRPGPSSKMPQGMQCHRLKRLTTTHVRKLLRAMLGEDVEVGFARRLHEVTGGNPLFLEATLRSLEDDDYLNTSEGALSVEIGRLFELQAPSSVRDVFRQRIQHLSEMLLEILSALAISLRPRPLQYLSVLLRQSPKALERPMIQLVERGFVVSLPSKSGLARYWIDQNPLRAVLRESLAPDKARQLHKRVANLLTARHPALESLSALADLDSWMHDRSEELAHHFAQAGDVQKALKHGLAAAEVARTQNQQNRALRLYRLTASYGQRQSSKTPEDEAPCSEYKLANYRSGEALAARGRYREAAEHFERVLNSQAEQTWQSTHAHWYLGQLKVRLGQFNDALTHINQGLEHLQRLTDENAQDSTHSILKGRLLRTRASVQLWTGSSDKSVRDGEASVEILGGEGLNREAHQVQPVIALARCLSGQLNAEDLHVEPLAWVRGLALPVLRGPQMGPDENLNSDLRDRIESALSQEDREEAALAFNHLGLHLRMQGRYEQALEAYESSVMLSEEMENIAAAAIGRMNIGALLLEIGDLDNAEACLELAADGAEHCESSWFNAVAQILLAQSFRLRQPVDREAWRDHWQRAEECLRDVQHSPARRELLLELAAFEWQEQGQMSVDFKQELFTHASNDQWLRFMSLRIARAIRGSGDVDEREIGRFRKLKASYVWREQQWRRDALLAEYWESRGQREDATEAAQRAKTSVHELGQQLSSKMQRRYFDDARRQRVNEQWQRLCQSPEEAQAAGEPYTAVEGEQS